MKNNKILPQVPHGAGDDEVETTTVKDQAPPHFQSWFDREPWGFITNDAPERIWLLEHPPRHYLHYDKHSKMWQVIDRWFDLCVITPQRRPQQAIKLFHLKFRGVVPSGASWFRRFLKSLSVAIHANVKTRRKAFEALLRHRL
jgi:hypothetical protein